MDTQPSMPTPNESMEHPRLIMDQDFHVRHAHKYIAVYVFLVVLLTVAGGTYAWQHYTLEKLVGQTKSLQTTSESLTKKLAEYATADAQKAKAIAPVAGWKTYCDPLHAECFNYPPDWTFDDSTSQPQLSRVIVLVTNPAKTVVVHYTNEHAKDGFLAAFRTNFVVNPTTPDMGFKIIGGYFLGSTRYRATMAVVDDATASKQVLKVGALNQLLNAARFQDKEKHTVQLVADGGQFTSAAAANAWFNTVDSRTAEAILQSIYYK